MKLDNAFLDRLKSLDANPEKQFAGTPVAKKLALLLRPAFIARPGKTFVWGDFSNIEARVLSTRTRRCPTSTCGRVPIWPARTCWRCGPR